MPWFADWCAISLGGGRLPAHHRRRPQPARARRRWCASCRSGSPPTRDSPRGGYEVLRTGVSELVPEITDELLELSAQDEEHLRLMRMLELRSGMSCAAQGRRPQSSASSPGSPASTAGGSPRPTSPSARTSPGAPPSPSTTPSCTPRCATAALELQRAVLPERLPDLPGLVDRRGLPARPVAPTPAATSTTSSRSSDGRVAMFVGDVMGRGVARRLGDGADALGDPHPGGGRPVARPW